MGLPVGTLSVALVGHTARVLSVVGLVAVGLVSGRAQACDLVGRPVDHLSVGFHAVTRGAGLAWEYNAAANRRFT